MADLKSFGLELMFTKKWL